MKDWYLRQTARDRVIVVCVGVLCVLGVLYAGVWHPLKTGLETRRQNIVVARETLQFMLDGEAKIRAHGGVRSQPVVDDGTPPYLLIDKVLKANGLSAPKSIRNNKSNGALVDYGEVEFDKLIKAIAELERRGLTVTDMNIRRKDKLPGKVDARFTMERG
ncbi:MAG: type II secretion system protein M [Gammaproteobacteria bacterium]|nr:type II secretion system protein M [Gammaproteobacteria bacterium]